MGAGGEEVQVGVFGGWTDVGVLGGGQKTTTYFSAQTGRHAHYSPQTQQNTTNN